MSTYRNGWPTKPIAFIRQSHDRPFYLNWWPYSVHFPMQAREQLIAKYRERKGPGIKNPIYAAMIEGMDTEIGRFFGALDEAGLRDNTLVMFKSDNGGYNGDNRPLRGFKGTLYEGGIRIPWIVRWPGKVKPNTTCTTPVISMDCYPTLLQASGLSPTLNQPIDGKSLLPLLEQSGEWDRDAIYIHYPNYAFHKRNRLGGVIRQGKYKLIKRYGDDTLELYNLSDDIGEKQNIAHRSEEKARTIGTQTRRLAEANRRQDAGPREIGLNRMETEDSIETFGLRLSVSGGGVGFARSSPDLPPANRWNHSVVIQCGRN